MLKFFGRGSAFADKHNSAFFIDEKNLVLIDCPATTFQEVKHFDFNEFDNIYVLVTHTHGDHTSGIGTLLQFLFFTTDKRLTVVAPSQEVYNDLLLLLKRIEGCEEEWFNIIVVNELNKKWLFKAVPTQHVEPLKNKCFGYVLNIGDTTVIYTGDTKTLEPFECYIKPDTYLYTEIAYYKSDVHLYYEDVIAKLSDLSLNGVKVFLMHLDNEKEIAELIKDKNIKFAPLYYEN